MKRLYLSLVNLFKPKKSPASPKELGYLAKRLFFKFGRQNKRR